MSVLEHLKVVQGKGAESFVHIKSLYPAAYIFLFSRNVWWSYPHPEVKANATDIWTIQSCRWFLLAELN